MCGGDKGGVLMCVLGCVCVCECVCGGGGGGGGRGCQCGCADVVLLITALLLYAPSAALLFDKENTYC